MANLAPTESDVKKEDGSQEAVIWGETVMKGDSVYLESDGKWWLTDAEDSTKPDANDEFGVALTDGVADQSGVVMKNNGDKINFGAILTQGKMYAHSATSGKIAPVDDLTAGTNEVQEASVSGATSGTFTLTFDGQTTAAIAYNASAGDVQTALIALSNIDSVSCTGGPLSSSAVAVEFTGNNAKTNVAEMTVTNSTDGTVSISTTTAGKANDYLNRLGYAETTSILVIDKKRTGILVT